MCEAEGKEQIEDANGLQIPEFVGQHDAAPQPQDDEDDEDDY